MQRIKFMKFNVPRLEYAVTKEYPWAHFNIFAFTISVIILAFLTFINVQAVGFEYVTVMDDYYPPIKGHWWTSLLRQPSPSCVPHQILQADNFMTNTSIFNYVVNSINATANKLATYPTSSTSSLSGIQYTAEPLAAACDVQNGIRILRLATDIVQNTVTGYVQFNCSFATSVMLVTASYTTSCLDASLNPFRRDIGFGNNITTVLDLLANDLLLATSNETNAPLGGGQICPVGQNSTQLEECNNTPVNMDVYSAAFVPIQLNRIGIPAKNYFNALLAASYADTGIWHNNSIFISENMANATLDPSGGTYVQDVMASGYYNLAPTPAVISVPYTCHYLSRKSPLNFVISVLVADLTLFATFWTIFTTIASIYARSKATTDLHRDAEMGSSALAPAGMSETLPMILKSPTTEFSAMEKAILATFDTPLDTHRDRP